MNRIEDRIKLLMKGTSARKFALMCGIKPSTFNHYISGKRNLSLEGAIKICSVTKASHKWLLTGEGDVYENVHPFLTNLTGWFESLDRDEKIWLDIEMKKKFPEFVEWQESQKKSENHFPLKSVRNIPHKNI